jgi:hypothetical protein
MMLMPVYATLGTLILLQLLMALLFPVRWSILRGDFLKRLERKLTEEYAVAYGAIPDEVAALVNTEREAVMNLAGEVTQVKVWLSEKESAAKVDDLYGH